MVVMRGMGYGDEWGDNFNLGKTGNHKGFDDAAGYVLADLVTYFNAHKGTGTNKIMVTGYSRAGGVANLLADKLLTRTEKLVPNKDLYVYTYEAPKGILTENATPYENVFNIINSQDIVQMMAPSQYGFARCGIDIDVYKDNVDELLLTYNSKLVLPTFTPSEGNFTNCGELANFIINTLLRYDSEEEKALGTRDAFVDNYGDAIKFIFSVIFNIKDTTKDAIIADIKAKVEESPFSVLSLISTGEALRDYLEPFLDADGLEYNDEELLNACTKATELVMGPGAPMLLLVAATETRTNLSRMIAMHYPLVNYILLKNYNPEA